MTHRHAREIHLAASLAALSDDSFERVYEMAFELLRADIDSRVQAPAVSPSVRPSAPAPGSLTSRLLIEAGLAELRANAPRTAPAVVDYPGVAELDERIGLIELRED